MNSLAKRLTEKAVRHDMLACLSTGETDHQKTGKYAGIR